MRKSNYTLEYNDHGSILVWSHYINTIPVDSCEVAVSEDDLNINAEQTY